MLVSNNQELNNKEVIILYGNGRAKAYVANNLSDNIKKFIQTKKTSKQDIIIYTKGIEEICRDKEFMKPKSRKLLIYCGNCKELFNIGKIGTIHEHKYGEHICMCQSCSELMATALGFDYSSNIERNTFNEESASDEDRRVIAEWASYMDMSVEDFIESQL